MSTILETEVTLINNKLKFSAKAQTNPEIILDYIPPLGDGEGYMPLELLLISLAACTASTVALLLRKFQKDVSGLTVSAKGERRETHPTSFETITLDFTLKSKDAQDADMQKVIKMSEDKYCPVWAMLKNNVEIKTQFKIIQ
jgi:putative redox protein